MAGCGSTPAWERAGADEVEVADPQGLAGLASAGKVQRWSGGVTAVAAPRPGLPRAGLMLPRVSPDGERVAFLDIDEIAPPSADAWVTGRGLAGVSLWVRAVADEGLARNIALDDAAWPTWSSDGGALWFISHDPATGCALMRHDVATDQTRRLSVGLEHILTPAVSPDGRWVAVIAYGQIADEALLFLIDPATGRVTPGPPPTLGGAQLAPQWLDRSTLLFVELDEQGGGLMRWTVGEAAAAPVAPLNLPVSIFDAVHLHAGIPGAIPGAGPVSDDGRWFAYYSLPEDRIELVDLTTGALRPLRQGDRAGAWWGGDWFVVGSDDQLALVALPGEAAGAEAQEGQVTDEPPRMNLLPGRWVPLWADPEAKSMLLIGEGEKPERFGVLQLWVITR